MQARLLAPLLALIALTPGCLSGFDGVPHDPNSLSYILPAGSSEKAPHPVQYQGEATKLTTFGVTWTASASAVDLILSGAPYPGAVPRASGPFALRGASGSLVTASGTYAFTDADLALEGAGAVSLAGGVTVTSRAEALFTGDALVLVPSFVVVQRPDEPAEVSLRIDAASEVASVKVRISRGAPDGFPEGGATGRLQLSPGSGELAAHGAGLRVTPTGALPFTASTVSYWHFQGVDAHFRIRGEPHQGPDGTLALTEARGSVTPAGLVVSLEGKAKQWTRARHPEFQAALAASPQESALRVDRGSNMSFWLRVTETGHVGTAVGVRPAVLDNASLGVGTGLDWYGSADPGALELFGNGFKNLFFGWFVDFRIADFDPGETKYLPVYVEAPEDATPGVHVLRIEVKGHNAASVVEVPVEVR